MEPIVNPEANLLKNQYTTANLCPWRYYR